jgi:acyl-CoA hydrolase
MNEQAPPATRPELFGKAAEARHDRRQSEARYRASCRGPVTTSRIDTHYVVTEFGSANLKGLSSTQRAHALIGLAHSQFDEELTAAAKKLNPS